MQGSSGRLARSALALLVCAFAALAVAAPAGARVKYVSVKWLKGYTAPATPKSLDKVGVIKIGSSKAKNVLVIEPGTSAGGAYFVPLAKWVTEKAPEWQVWAVERRENLLEEQNEAQKFKQGKLSGEAFFNYYLGYLSNAKVKKHYKPVTFAEAKASGAREWGMTVAVNDLHVVIEEAKKAGGKVVLAGHSLGGSVVTAYATWDFSGTPGADGLSGLVYIDGGSNPTPVTKAKAEEELAAINPENPWLAFGGVPAPDLGLFSLTGAAAALVNPLEASVAEEFPFLPEDLKAKNSKGELVHADNEGEFGYGVNVGTSPVALAAAQVHAGTGLSEPGLYSPLWGWNGAGALTPLHRYAEMLAGAEVKDADGTEWYFPERLTVDTGAVGNGISNEAQAVLGEHAIHGTELPTSLHILAINSELDKLAGPGFSTLTFAEDLAAQSHIPNANLTLINEEDTYAHNDPNGAYPTNAFVEALIPFLKGV